MSNEREPIRELFIEELEEVTGGTNKVKEFIDEHLQTTYACGEEGPDC